MIAFDTNDFIYCCDDGDPRRKGIAMDLVSLEIVNPFA
jgi:hypothetical protein